MNETWLAQLSIEPVIQFEQLHGGDINQTYHLKTDKNDYLLKTQINGDPNFYEHEIEGLQLLNQVVRSPKVIDFGVIEQTPYLLMEFLSVGYEGSQFELGQLVAHLHQVQSPNQKYGFDKDYLLGKTPKYNQWEDDWETFFVNHRLRVLRDCLMKDGRWDENREQQFEQGLTYFHQLLTTYDAQPSLLHGDLWSGNFVFLTDGQPALIDPDVYYGDREFDLGVATVFGGFTTEFFEGYQSVLPLNLGYEQRLKFYQLYYLMVHVHLFGEQYGGGLDSLLAQISQFVD